jgi:hypothetical protein
MCYSAQVVQVIRKLHRELGIRLDYTEALNLSCGVSMIQVWSSRAVSKPILTFPELQAILSDRIVPALPHAALKAA